MVTGAHQVIVVDAANVVGSRPDGWWRDRPGAARRLLRQLADLQERLEDTEIVVILEGAARSATSGPDAPDTAALRVVLAPGSGDDTIVTTTAAITNAHVTPWLPPRIWPNRRINPVSEARRNVVLRVEDIGKRPSLGYFRTRKLVSGFYLVKVDGTSSSRSTA